MVNFQPAPSYSCYFCMTVFYFLQLCLRSLIWEQANMKGRICTCVCVLVGCLLLKSGEETAAEAVWDVRGYTHRWGEMSFTGLPPYFLFLSPLRSGAGLYCQARCSCGGFGSPWGSPHPARYLGVTEHLAPVTGGKQLGSNSCILAFSHFYTYF